MKKIIALLGLVFTVATAEAQAGSGSVILAWDASTAPSTNIAGYKIYWGTNTPGIYNVTISVGNVLSATISNLVRNIPNYFAATTLGVDGLESTNKSNEISYTSPCSYVLTPNAVGITAAAQTNALTVSADSNCSWGSANTTPWLTIVPTAGVGSATITWAATANTSTSPRTGVVSIAGQTFTVTQAGGAPMPPPAPTNLRKVSGT